MQIGGRPTYWRTNEWKHVTTGLDDDGIGVVVGDAGCDDAMAWGDDGARRGHVASNSLN